jgi:hypothetical protein
MSKAKLTTSQSADIDLAISNDAERPRGGLISMATTRRRYNATATHVAIGLLLSHASTRLWSPIPSEI